MKLEKLVISEIATIKNATIEFDKEPLKDAPIFLISGPTGAGKSTILDCISLAFYNSAPRYEGNKQDKYTDGDGNTVSLSDLSQILRHGATDGKIELYFNSTETNGVHHYCITWNICYRPNNKEDNRYPYKWQLEEIVGTTRNKLGDQQRASALQSKIVGLVGLEYKDFLRASMLAQGEFSKFLESSNKEKADILKTLTGQDVYSKVGQAIADAYRDAKDKAKTANTTLEAISKLSDEDREKLESDIKDNDEKLEKLEDSIKDASLKKDWLAEIEKFDKNIADFKKEKDDAETVVTSADFLEKQQLVADWDKSKVARSIKKQLSNAENELDKHNKKEADYKKQYANLLFVLDKKNAELKEVKNGIDDLQAYFNNLSDAEKRMYENYSSISTLLKSADSQKKEVSNCQEKIDKFTKELPGLKEAVTKAEEEFKTENNNLKELKSAYEADLDDKKKVDPNGDITIRYGNLNTIETELNTLYNYRQQIETEVGNLKTEEDKKTQLPNKSDLDNESLQADSAFKEAQHFFAITQKNTKSVLDNLRPTLKIGDKCPLCGAPITSNHSDAELESIVKNQQKAYEEARKRADDASQAIKDYNKNLKEIEEEIEKISKRKDKDDLNFDTQLIKVKDAYEKASISYREESFSDCRNIQLEKNRIGQEKGNLEASVKRLAEINKSLSRTEPDYQKKFKYVNGTCSENMTKAKDAVEDATKSIKNEEESKKHLEHNETGFLNQIKDLVCIPNWEAIYRDDYTKLDKKIKDLKDTFDNNTQQKESLENRLSDLQHIVQSVDLRNIASTYNWNDIVPMAGAGSNDLVRDASSLNTNMASWQSTKETYSENIGRLKDTLKEECTSNSLTLERLETLEKLVESQIDETHQYVDKELETYSSADNNIDSQKKLKEEYLDVNPKPLFKEEEKAYKSADFETLIEQLNNEKDNCTTNKGTYNQKLKTDNTQIEKYKEADSDKKKAEHKAEIYKVLNDMLGGEKGFKFNTVAQGLILNVLLKRANDYMSFFDDDFEITAQGNNMIILLKDKRSGGDLMSYKSLSGGQKFMVSLALALALSDLGGKKQNKFDTLFIDEGFGSLSEDYLNAVMNCLKSLNNLTKKQVGIISHVESLRREIPAKIIVKGGSGAAPSQVKVCYGQD